MKKPTKTMLFAMFAGTAAPYQVRAASPRHAAPKAQQQQVDRRSRTIFWHVHWQFPAAQESVHDQRFSEQSPIRSMLQQHISLTPGNSVKRHALRAYVEAGVQTLQIVMKKEHCQVRQFSADRCWLLVAPAKSESVIHPGQEIVLARNVLARKSLWQEQP